MLVLKIIFLNYFAIGFSKPETSCVDVEKIQFDENFCLSVAAYLMAIAQQGKNNCIRLFFFYIF